MRESSHKILLIDRLNLKMVALFFLTFAVFIKPTISHTLVFFGIDSLPVYLDYAICGGFALFSFIAVCFVLINRRRGPGFFLSSTILMACITALSSILFPGNGTSGLISQGGFVLGSAIKTWCMDWIPLLGTVCTIAAFARAHSKELVWGFFLATILYLIINAISLVQQLNLAPEINTLFFGYRNITFRIAIPAYACALVIACHHKRIWATLPIAVFCLGLVQIMFAYSATSLCAFCVMGVTSIALLWNKSRILLNALTYGISYVVLFVLIVIFRLQTYLGLILYPLLHKDVTFTGRTELWDSVFAHLQDAHFFIGYGNDYYWHVLSLNGIFQKHAHNEILNMLMLGGICATLCIIALYCLSIHRLFRFKETAISAAFSAGLAGFLVISLTEVALCPGLFFVLAGSYYLTSPLLNSQEETTAHN